MLLEIRDAVEDISPQIKIIPLLDDPAILMKNELGAPIYRGGGIFVERHGHDPIHQDDVSILGDGKDLHFNAIAAL